MDYAQISLLAVILVAITAIILSAARDWRVSLSALGIQYIGVFVLIIVSWPWELAVVKLVAGWIAASVLGIALVGVRHDVNLERHWFSEISFRIFPAGLVALTVFSLAPSLHDWFITATESQLLGGLILICMGVLHLGLTVQPWRAVLGLLTVFSGFEILYATVESSTLVTGMLGVTTLGIALIGAYLLTAPEMESEE